MGTDRVSVLWSRVSPWLALAVAGVLIINAAVVVGDSLLGGIAVSVGLCALLALYRQSWLWFPHTPGSAVAVSAIGFLTMGAVVGVGVGALGGVASFPNVRFDQFDTTGAILFGLIYGGGLAWVRWTAFREAGREQQFAAGPERPGQASG